MGYDLEDRVLLVVCAIGAIIVWFDVYVWRNV